MALFVFPAAPARAGVIASHLPRHGRRRITQETIVFGPGDMATAHRSGEFVPVAELNRCVEYFESTIMNLCGPGSGSPNRISHKFSIPAHFFDR